MRKVGELESAEKEARKKTREFTRRVVRIGTSPPCSELRGCPESVSGCKTSQLGSE